MKRPRRLALSWSPPRYPGGAGARRRHSRRAFLHVKPGMRQFRRWPGEASVREMPQVELMLRELCRLAGTDRRPPTYRCRTAHFVSADTCHTHIADHVESGRRASPSRLRLARADADKWRTGIA